MGGFGRFIVVGVGAVVPICCTAVVVFVVPVGPGVVSSSAVFSGIQARPGIPAPRRGRYAG